MLEARQSYRKRTYLGGRIVFNHKRSTFDCLVRNMTPHGAKLQFSDGIPMPGIFDLMMPERGETRHAKLVWLGNGEAGVMFADRCDGNVVRFDMSQRMNWLERERGKLQAERRVDAVDTVDE